MPKIIIHPPGTTNEDVIEMRRQRILAMTSRERVLLAFELMALAAAFKKGPLKQPQGKGVVLRKPPEK